VAVEVVADGLDDAGADAQRGGLLGGAQPEVAVLHEEAGTVLLGADREGLRLGHDAHAGDLQLETAWAARVGGHLAVHLQRGLDRQGVEMLENLVRHHALGQHALHHAAAVAHLQELQLAGGAAVGQPALHADDVPDVLRESAHARDGRLAAAHGESPAYRIRASPRRGRRMIR
jgi:hypothetical protein